MRLVSWDCGAGFHRKVEPPLALRPDIAVIQKCTDLKVLVHKAPRFKPTFTLDGKQSESGSRRVCVRFQQLEQGDKTDNSITYLCPLIAIVLLASPGR